MHACRCWPTTLMHDNHYTMWEWWGAKSEIEWNGQRKIEDGLSLTLTLFFLLLFIASSCRSFSISQCCRTCCGGSCINSDEWVCISKKETREREKRFWGVGGKKAKCEKSFAKSIFRSNNYNSLHMFSWVQRQRQSRVVCLRARLDSTEKFAEFILCSSGRWHLNLPWTEV